MENRPERTLYRVRKRRAFIYWIPAFAGMVKWGAARYKVRKRRAFIYWIPACAGMANGGVGWLPPGCGGGLCTGIEPAG